MLNPRKSGPHRGAVRRLLGTCLLSLACVLGGTISQAWAQLYGDGSDGAYTVAASETLTSDKNYTDLTVSGGVTLNTAGFEVRVNGTLTNNGTITDAQSGGSGGGGGSQGLGGVTTPGANGMDGSAGLSGASGAGSGGHGGGGGAGGGGAYDSDDGEFAPGGNGGQGGVGGKGGGSVRVYARQLVNNGLIHADGLPGQPGLGGQSGAYTTYTEALFTSRDLAGGGGGGGAGGNGGNGGSVFVVYETLLTAGLIRAQGGGPGGAGFSGNGLSAHFSAGSSTFEFNGGNGGGSGGDGGRGEIDSDISGNGVNGQSGNPGVPGNITLTQSTKCFVDADGDNFGKADDPGADVMIACGAGFSNNNGDCDDGSVSIYPGAPEIPNDGVDQDCDGQDLTLSCCTGRVGDSNGMGGDEPTLGDISTLIDALFITSDPGILLCLAEADANQSGGVSPTGGDITLGDVSLLIDYLFIHGPWDGTSNPTGIVLPGCL